MFLWYLGGICLSVKTVTFLRLIDRVFLSLKKSAICVAVVVYRPGSSTVTSAFFNDLSDLLDRLSVHTDPLVLAGDINIRLERVTDSDAVEFNNLISGVCVGQSIGCVWWCIAFHIHPRRLSRFDAQCPSYASEWVGRRLDNRAAVCWHRLTVPLPPVFYGCRKLLQCGGDIISQCANAAAETGEEAHRSVMYQTARVRVDPKYLTTSGQSNCLSIRWCVCPHKRIAGTAPPNFNKLSDVSVMMT